MKEIRFSIISLLLLVSMKGIKGDAQTMALKTNLLYDLTTTLNLGVEVGLHKQWTLDLSGNLNAWEFGSNRKIKHWLAQPELRYWTCDRFFGHFLGVHAFAGQFNMGGIKPLGLGDRRYEGDLWGGGFSYGYQWILNKRLNMEASIGVGYAYLVYDRFPCERCGQKLYTGSRSYIGPTKISLSLIYVIK